MFWEVLVGTLVRAGMLCTLRPSVQSTCHLPCTGGGWQVVAAKGQLPAKLTH